MQWEYKADCIEVDSYELLQEKLNELGVDGWELIHIQESIVKEWSGGELDYSYISGYNVILKRVRCP